MSETTDQLVFFLILFIPIWLVFTGLLTAAQITSSTHATSIMGFNVTDVNITNGSYVPAAASQQDFITSYLGFHANVWIIDFFIGVIIVYIVLWGAPAQFLHL